MKLRFAVNQRVFVYQESIDMRAGFNRLQSLIGQGFGAGLYEGHLFLFLGKNRKRLKILYFDGTGLVLLAKRLERAQFMPIEDLYSRQEISPEDLERIFDGVNLKLSFVAKKRSESGAELA